METDYLHFKPHGGINGIMWCAITSFCKFACDFPVTVMQI